MGKGSEDLGKKERCKSSDDCENIAAICNDANVEQSDNQFVTRGMPTEAALKVLVEKIGFSEGSTKVSTLADGDVLRCCRLWSELEQRLATLEFDRDQKSMGVMVDSSSGRKLLLVKGAVENVLERSTNWRALVLEESSRSFSCFFAYFFVYSTLCFFLYKIKFL